MHSVGLALVLRISMIFSAPPGEARLPFRYLAHKLRWLARPVHSYQD